MKDLSRLCCQNSLCPDYGKRGLGNLRLAGWSGKGKRIRMLQCKTCLRPFSERKGTPLSGSHLPEKEAVSILEHLAENCGIRQTGRLTGHTKDTVNRLAKMAGHHGQALHDELVAFSPGDDRGATRREVGLRGQKGGKLRARRKRPRG